MRDAISIPRVELLHPAIRTEVRQLIDKAEARISRCAIRVTQGLRPFAEQDALYAQGRTKPGPRVTNAKAGQSPHQYGLAWDMVLLYDKDGNGTHESVSWDTLKDFDKDGESDWMEIVDIFEKAGYTWGGRFNSIPDAPHFEKTFGLTWRQLLEKHYKKDFIKGNNYVAI